MANTDFITEQGLAQYHDELMETHIAGGAVFDISAYHASGNPLTPATYADLAAALGTNGTNIPPKLRRPGMSVKFVCSADNKYVQYRLMSDTFNTIVSDWQGVDEVPVPGSKNFVESGGVYDNTLEEKEHPIADNEVASYLTDKNKTVIGKLMKNGSVVFLELNDRDKAIDELLANVSTEVPDSGNNVIKYLTDRDGVVIATINSVGTTNFKGGGGFDGEVTESKNINLDAIKVLTDNNNSVIGWITSKGEVHIEELDVNKLKVKDNTDIGIPSQLFPLLGFIASGTENHKFVTDKTYNLLFATKGIYLKDGVNIETFPALSLQDDDSYDYQLPESYIPGATAETTPTSSRINRGGFASLLFPIVKSLNVKHAGSINGGKITCASVAEGQRIGLTPYQNSSDEFNGQLNNCGKIIKELIEREDWEIICHSMTVREGYHRNSYLVNGLNSEFAQSLLIDATYTGEGGFSTYTTTCYDIVTKKNYMVKPDFSGWDILPDKYIKPYLQLTKATDSPLVVNPTYSVKYQVKTWQDRAVHAGLPYTNLLAGWGTSHSSWHVREDMKYVDTVFASGGTFKINTVPFAVNPNRNPLRVTAPSTETSDNGYNVYNKRNYQEYIEHIDSLVDCKGWSILRPHFYEPQYYNGYIDYFSDIYGADSDDCGPLCYKDENYPEEWIQPLKYEHIMDMIGENIYNYWENPPLHKRNLDGTLSNEMMDDWSEWYPCPGTTSAMIYDIFEYAISKGVYFMRSEDALKKWGNLFAIGYENVVVLDPDKYLLPEYVNLSHCRIGADGSIDFYNV